MQKRLSLIILGTIFISFILLLVISLFSIRHFGMKNAEENAEILIRENEIVATFNADPYYVENSEMEDEIIREIEKNGMQEITNLDDLEQAEAQLDLTNTKHGKIYKAGACKFAII